MSDFHRKVVMHDETRMLHVCVEFANLYILLVIVIWLKLFPIVQSN